MIGLFSNTVKSVSKLPDIPDVPFLNSEPYTNTVKPVVPKAAKPALLYGATVNVDPEIAVIIPLRDTVASEMFTVSFTRNT